MGTRDTAPGCCSQCWDRSTDNPISYPSVRPRGGVKTIEDSWGACYGSAGYLEPVPFETV